TRPLQQQRPRLGRVQLQGRERARRRPRHGAPAGCALSPLQLYSTETRPLLLLAPQLTCLLDPTCAHSALSTSLSAPARAQYALVPSSSSATPGHSFSVPGRCCCSMIFFTLSAAAIWSGMPELWPSPCPGAPSMIASCHATPGFCDACGMQSMSEPMAMTGLP